MELSRIRKADEALDGAQDAILRPHRSAWCPGGWAVQQPAFQKVVDRGGADGLHVGDVRFDQVERLNWRNDPRLVADGLRGEVEQFQLLPGGWSSSTSPSGQSGVNVHTRSGSAAGAPAVRSQVGRFAGLHPLLLVPGRTKTRGGRGCGSHGDFDASGRTFDRSYFDFRDGDAGVNLRGFQTDDGPAAVARK